MTMETAEVQNPLLATSSRDMGIRRGGGMDAGRPVLSYAHLREAQAAGKGAGLRRYAIVMRMPDRDGTPGAGPVSLMPAEKEQKWYGQNYRHCVGTPVEGGYDTTLVAPTPNVPPARWVPSMIEDAMALGDPIPEELAPPAYTGPTFKTKRAGETAEDPVYDIPAPVVPNLEYLNAEGLRAYADEHQIHLENRQGVVQMRAEIAAALGLTDEVATENHDAEQST